MKTNTITPDNFTRVNNDVNGNPRYVIHFLDLLSELEYEKTAGKGLNSISNQYDIVIKKAKKIGGKKFNTKAYGGGIVFQSYNLPDLVKKCNELLTPKN
jgi:hypothetical protein